MQEQILYFLQSFSSPVTNLLAQGVTMLGEQYVVMLIMAVIYWGVSREKGFFLAAVMLASLYFNNFLKIIVHSPRPFEVLDGLRGQRLETATGWSFPSGHTQGATSFYATLFILYRKSILRTLFVLIILLIGISRVFLGVHWPLDVLGGWGFGVLVVWLVYALFQKSQNDDSRKDRYLFMIVLLSLAVTLLMSAFVLLFVEETVQTYDFIKSAGLLVGAISGYLLEKRISHFDAESGGLFLKFLRIIPGILGALIVQEGLKAIFPDQYLFHGIRYLLLGLWFTFLFPWLGCRFNLFSRQ